MFVLGLQGSPRKKGNSDFLLEKFLEAAASRGAQTEMIRVDKKEIVPCKEYIVCEKKGYCPIDDEMTREIYPLIRQADLIVLATPVFFFNMTAQLKAVVDRCQTFWARKYRMRLSDPGKKMRKGFLLAVGASKAPRLFDGLELTVKYFYDAVDATDAGKLTYPNIEHRKDMAKYPGIEAEIEKAVVDVMTSFSDRKKVVFACRENACRSQMAEAFTRHFAGDRFEAFSGGNSPASEVNKLMVNAMAEIGIDMAFRIPRSFESIPTEPLPDMLVRMGCEVECPILPGVPQLDWELEDPAGKSIEIMRKVRDDIETRVRALVAEPNN